MATKTKLNLKPGDLLVNYKNQKNICYIQGTTNSGKELVLFWFTQENRHRYYTEEDIRVWIQRGTYVHYPVVE